MHVGAFMHLANTKAALGVPQHLNWTFERTVVWQQFYAMADRWVSSGLLARVRADVALPEPRRRICCTSRC